MASHQACLPVPRRRKRASSDDENVASTAMEFSAIESMDAMEYMAAVVQQANSMPDHFVSNEIPEQENQARPSSPPIDGSASSLAYLTSDRTSTMDPPTIQHLPRRPEEWVDATLGNFYQLREYLERCYQNGVGAKGNKQFLVPPLRERAGWHIFCVGPEEARGNIGAYFEQDDSSDDEESVSSWQRDVPASGHEPSVRLLCQMDQVMVRRVISHLTYYLQEGWQFTPQRSAWLYALLASLERPLHREDAALLYSLLKQLTQIRTKIDVVSDRQKLGQVNVLIAVIGIYFEQGGGFNGIMSVRR